MKIKINKPIIIIAIAICIGIISSIGVTALLKANSQNIENKTSVGDVKLEVVSDFELPESLTAGNVIKTAPAIKNVGSQDCFIRLSVEYTDSMATQFCSDLKINLDDWTKKQPDGYYYYKHILKSDETSTPLFTNIELKDNASADVDMQIYSEGVCSENYKDSAYFTAFSKYNQN